MTDQMRERQQLEGFRTNTNERTDFEVMNLRRGEVLSRLLVTYFPFQITRPF